MKRRAVLMCILLVSSMLLTTAAVTAKKPENPGGGGGGGDTGPTGTIFYEAPDDSGTSYIWTMDADGSNKATLAEGSAYYQSLSWEKHNGQYWYLRFVIIEGPSHPDGQERYEIEAFKDDNTGSVTIYSDASMAYQRLNWCDAPFWVPGDEYISWAGKTWTDNGDGTFSEGSFGVYKAKVEYSTNGDITGVEDPVLVYETGYFYDDYEGINYPDLAMFSWNPSGNQLALHMEGGIYIDSVPAGTSPTYLTDGGWPQWSPDGSKIGFFRTKEILVINTDGSGLKSLVKVKTTKGAFHDIFHFTWSPDGKYIVYTLHERNRQTWDQKTYMYTIGSDGSDNTKISGFDATVWKVSKAWR
jgi:hypothetical protein